MSLLTYFLLMGAISALVMCRIIDECTAPKRSDLWKLADIKEQLRRWK
jgi:hypothetical protein